MDLQTRQLGKRLRSLEGACEIARINRGQSFVVQRACGCLGLAAATRRKRCGGMTAEAAFGVSFRLSVPDEKDVRRVGHRTCNLRGDGFGLQLLRLIVCDERVDEWVEIAFHHEVELVNRQADAVISDAVLFEVVGADLLGAIAGAHH